MPRPEAHPELDRFLLHALTAQPPLPDLAGFAANTFSLTRQAVNRHLRDLANAGVIRPSGAKRPRRYELVTIEAVRHFSRAGLQEDQVWRDFVRPYLDPLPENVRNICQYGLTEMVNNAVDHSEGSQVVVSLMLNAVQVRIIVIDDGVGVFKKIKDALNLERESDVILELSKGKLTTDPSRHTGEGIFFTSRVFDNFSLRAGRLLFDHSPDDDDWLLERGEWGPGTAVHMEIDPASRRTIPEVFERFAEPDEFRFSITHVPVKLAQLGEDTLISRSQGRRLVARFERFAKVVLNFADVRSIGQAFADEVFRVFPAHHPEVHLTCINASPDVLRMIDRVRAGDTPSAST